MNLYYNGIENKKENVMPNNILEELKTKFEDFASELENIEPEKVDLTQIDRLIALVEELDNEIKTIK